MSMPFSLTSNVKKDVSATVQEELVSSTTQFMDTANLFLRTATNILQRQEDAIDTMNLWEKQHSIIIGMLERIEQQTVKEEKVSNIDTT
jgi:hypothetical protein